MQNQENYDIIIAQIASKLKKIRIEKGFSSYENFAYENDLPRVQYWRMEKGTNFTIKNLLRILEIHNITIEDFFKDL
jgi:predicted transcriptional regulator